MADGRNFFPLSWSNKPDPTDTSGGQVRSLYSRLINRFRLTDQFPNAPLTQLLLFHKRIVPVTSIDELCKTINLVKIRDNVDPGAAGWYVLTTVPVGKRWTLYNMSVAKRSGATITFDQIGLQNPGGDILAYSVAAPATTMYYVFPCPNPSDSSWNIIVHVAGYTAGDKLDSWIHYLEEDAY